VIVKQGGHDRARRNFLRSGGGIAGVIALPVTLQHLFLPSENDRLLAQQHGDVTSEEDSDHALLQAALDRRGVVRLDRSYVIDKPLTVRSDTQITGSAVAQGHARIVWRGPPMQPILRDGSVVDPTEVNRNIVLQDFEIVGDGKGAPEQIGIEFYRTASVTIRNITVHGVGGSGIRWGNSMADTTDILVERCRVYNCRAGDAIQGGGRRIIIRNNIVGREDGTHSFGDTGIALLTDFEASTNPAPQRHPVDVTIIGNSIVGNEVLGVTSSYSGSQTGIALGPFAIDHDAAVKIADNQVRRCHVNIWIAVMRGVTLSGNDLGQHSSRLTASLRLDGVSRLRIEGNVIAFAGSGPDAGRDLAAILLNAQRNVFGASTFDADVTDFVIRANEITSAHGGEGIRLAFGQDNRTPRYVSRMGHGMIQGNRFVGIDKPVVFASQYGENPNVCRDVVVRGNVVDGRATSIAFMTGKPAQYRGVIVDRNTAPARVRPYLGTGAVRTPAAIARRSPTGS
jgi:hypothetical protein